MTAPDAMPERVEQPTVDEIQAGTAYITADPVAHKVCNWMIAFGRRDAESRLLAAEARVREVEAERDAIADNCARASSGWIAATADFERLRAERDALVPLARVGLFLRDKLLAGVTNTDLREHLVWCLEEWVVAIDGEDTPRTTKARAILAREET